MQNTVGGVPEVIGGNFEASVKLIKSIGYLWFYLVQVLSSATFWVLYWVQ